MGLKAGEIKVNTERGIFAGSLLFGRVGRRTLNHTMMMITYKMKEWLRPVRDNGDLQVMCENAPFPPGQIKEKSVRAVPRKMHRKAVNRSRGKAAKFNRIEQTLI